MITDRPFYLPRNYSHTTGKAPIFFLGVLVLYTLLSPFYIFKSGLPQPSDVLLFTGILAMYLVFAVKPGARIRNIYLTGAAFAVYTVLINLIHCAFYYDIRFLLSSLYYVYNFSVFCLISYIFHRSPDRAGKLMRFALLAVIAIELILLFTTGHARRAEGTFNNPNQFTYWALLAGIILIILRHRRRLNGLDFAALFALGYIQMQTLSKAGLITYTLFMAVVFFTPRVNVAVRSALLFLVVCFGIYAVFEADRLAEYAGNIDSIERAAQRLEGIGQEGDDSAEARGYDRIFNFPEYAILGAGEGAYHRFHPRGRNQELHSGIATLVFSYGVLGTGLFALFIFSVFREKPWYYTAFFFIVLMYGLTHQNIRFTDFWVFLGLINALPVRKREAIPESRKFLQPLMHSS